MCVLVCRSTDKHDGCIFVVKRRLSIFAPERGGRTRNESNKYADMFTRITSNVARLLYECEWAQCRSRKYSILYGTALVDYAVSYCGVPISCSRNVRGRLNHWKVVERSELQQKCEIRYGAAFKFTGKPHISFRIWKITKTGRRKLAHPLALVVISKCWNVDND